jgi:hypothetical protein
MRKFEGLLCWEKDAIIHLAPLDAPRDSLRDAMPLLSKN